MKRKAAEVRTEDYKVSYLIYCRKDDFLRYENLESVKDTPEAALAEAKKHVHRGRVIIKEQLERTYQQLPMTPVCT